jgi:hypothetical protein
MGTSQRPHCLYCDELVQAHERKTACDRCLSWHHQECWDALGHCAACKATDAVGDADDAPKPAAAAKESRPERKPQEKVPSPEGITMEDTGSELSFTRRWFSCVAIFLTFFCIFWDGFLIVWYAIALNQESVEVVALLFPLIHAAVGIGLTYFVVCSYVNRTVIRVTGNTLSVTHGPLPWPGGKELDAKDIKQLYCDSKVHRGKNGTSTTYQLHAIDRQENQIKLLKGITEPGQVRYIEQEIERFLGIEDSAVPGELSA